ncbi:MAG: hypothetical protein A3F87_03485 [Omnitrophica WOR_2 bacterium RIFCSPLOWO2_12_FULL_51_24]|nr:MAG: hypothetical protein A2879_01880 [Omnitrophica WOR_2 bacterium RIFCSPHIGHO2_01_FULL_49_10]OGX32562.1 MAG: hypothetical protein A3I43_00030 [Omnitrophica WOR_2 bacterium RIFCSPLOWO2_02_FULL_50_19]OGX43069.1 MAG: hypothetical protein A3F87_03485 [Omnitrophica WOR_2 bacterium RIFCSPLOWO2_12_FULL_51_24]
MGDNWTHIFIPFICLAANIFIQISVFKFFPGTGLLKSLFLGFACGFLALFLINPGIMLASNLLIYALLGYCYFHFVNMGETARRIRILLELSEVSGGLSLRDILGRYNARDIIDRRLARLVNNGQVKCENGRYYIGNLTVLTMARFTAAAKSVIFGKTP